MSKPRHISKLIQEFVLETKEKSKDAIPYTGSYTFKFFKEFNDVEPKMKDAV